jgi:hypothetical protein
MKSCNLIKIEWVPLKILISNFELFTCYFVISEKLNKPKSQIFRNIQLLRNV